MESEDRLVLQSLVISDPGFTVIIGAPQPRWVIGAGVEYSGLSRIGSYRQCESIARQTLAEWLPTRYLTGLRCPEPFDFARDKPCRKAVEGLATGQKVQVNEQ